MRRPGISSILEYWCLSMDSPHPLEYQLEGRLCEPIRRPSSSSSVLGVDPISLSESTKGQGGGTEWEEEESV